MLREGGEEAGRERTRDLSLSEGWALGRHQKERKKDTSFNDYDIPALSLSLPPLLFSLSLLLRIVLYYTRERESGQFTHLTKKKKKKDSCRDCRRTENNNTIWRERGRKRERERKGERERERGRLSASPFATLNLSD